MKNQKCSKEYRMIVAIGFIVAFMSYVSCAGEDQYCYVCSGHRCLQNPMDPDLFPGRTKCHAVEKYCVTHVRYLVNNASLKAHEEKGTPLQPHHYSPHSVTRACAKTYLGNLCRRDYLGLPQITCISTCNTDFCNCDSRSPPPEQFVGGKPTYESPKKSTYSANDLLSCQAMAGVPGYETESELMVRRDQAHDPEMFEERMKKRRKWFRRNGAAGIIVSLKLTLISIGVCVCAIWNV